MEIEWENQDWRVITNPAADYANITVRIKVPEGFGHKEGNELMVTLLGLIMDGERMKQVRANMDKAIDIGATSIDPRELRKTL